MTTTERADLHAAVDAFLDGKPVEERNTNPDNAWRPHEGPMVITAGVLYRVALDAVKIGDGYRELDEDEKGGQFWPNLDEIECISYAGEWMNGYCGDNVNCRYRTRLTREELAAKRRGE